MRVNIANQFQQPTTASAVTPVTATAQLPLTVTRPNATTHPEDSLNPVGVFIQWSAITLAGTNSYQVQVQQSSDNAGQNNVLTVADTGTLLSTSPLLLAPNTSLFLRIDWNLVTQQYLTVKITLAGNSTPSWSILMASLMNLNDVPSGLGTMVVANYTP